MLIVPRDFKFHNAPYLRWPYCFVYHSIGKTVIRKMKRVIEYIKRIEQYERTSDEVSERPECGRGGSTWLGKPHCDHVTLILSHQIPINHLLATCLCLYEFTDESVSCTVIIANTERATFSLFISLHPRINDPWSSNSGNNWIFRVFLQAQHFLCVRKYKCQKSQVVDYLNIYVDNVLQLRIWLLKLCHTSLDNVYREKLLRSLYRGYRFSKRRINWKKWYHNVEQKKKLGPYIRSNDSIFNLRTTTKTRQQRKTQNI